MYNDLAFEDYKDRLLTIILSFSLAYVHCNTKSLLKVTWTMVYWIT